jgi:hypothetical protein
VRVRIRAALVRASATTGQQIVAVLPGTALLPGLVDRLIAKGVVVIASDSRDDDTPLLLSPAINWLPLLLFYAFVWLALARPIHLLAARLEAYTSAVQKLLERQQGP